MEIEVQTIFAIINKKNFKMMTILKQADFKGYIGIEYEGSKLSEEEGIRKTKALIEKVSKQLKYNLV